MEPFVKIAKDYKLYSEAFHGEFFVTRGRHIPYPQVGIGFAAGRANLEDATYRAAVSCFTPSQERALTYAINFTSMRTYIGG